MNISDVKKNHPTFLTDNILINKVGRINYYIDPRTRIATDGEIQKVKPIAWNHTYFWIVCPFCQKIHQYSIMHTRKDKHVVYANCKGRINNGIDQQPLLIDSI